MTTIHQLKGQDVVPVQTREDFSGSEQQLATVETSSTAIAAQAKAAVESRYIMAMRRPRNWDDVRTRLLRECDRPSFAAVARYKKPIGKGVEGLSIRFVEAALRCMTNVLPEVMAVYDDTTKKIVRVTVTDLEGNITYSQDVTITKTVERSKPADDGSYISVRTNSYGNKTYTVPGTDDDILNKENALISKAIRTLGLRLIPGDIQDEAEARLIKTARNKAAQDPDAERKSITDAFASLNVTPSMLEEYLDQKLTQLTPAQLVDLRALYSALRDGEATWKTVMDNKAAQTGKPKSPANDAGTSDAKGSDPITDSSGEVWDQSKHATGSDGKPVFNSDGSFRKRRGAAQPEPPQADRDLRGWIENATTPEALDRLREAVDALPDGQDKSTLKALCLNRFQAIQGDGFGME